MARLLTRLIKARPLPTCRPTTLFVAPVGIKNQFYINKKWGHNAPCTYDSVRERIMLVLHCFDKIDPEKLTLEAHFIHDLGLDSLDHTEIIMELEDEFNFEIPDKDAEKLLRPADIVRYISDHEEAYEALQHHDHHDAHDNHGHASAHHSSAGHHSDHMSTNPAKREFSSMSYMARRYASLFGNGDGVKFPSSFDVDRHDPPKIEEVQDRVMKVLAKYDKIDSEKLDLGAHFVDDLGLDSLDQVEILMEMEDEFGVEIPDQEGEKLMRPAELAKYIWHKEAAKAETHATSRPF